MKRSFWLRKVGAIILFGTLAVVVLGFVVMTIWNNVLTSVMHVAPITFAQALAIFVLAKILFGGFRGGGGWKGRRGMWTNEMKEKWSHMSPEEKEKVKHEWRDRCNMWRSRQKTEVTSTNDQGLS